MRAEWRVLAAVGPGVAARVVGEEGAGVGTVLSFNAIEDAEPEVPEGPGVLFVRSGWAGADGPPAWMPGQRARAMMGLEALERMAHGRKLVLWPRATDAVSDVPGVLTFLRGHPAWRFVLDPAALMTPDMEARAPDHLARMVEALAGHEGLMGLVMPPGGHVLEEMVERARAEMITGVAALRLDQKTLVAPAPE